MQKMLDDTMTLKRSRSLWPLLWIFSIALVVNACASAPKFPTKDVWKRT